MAWNPSISSGTGATTTTTSRALDERTRRQQAALGTDLDERARRQAAAIGGSSTSSSSITVPFIASRTPVSPLPSSVAASMTVTTVVHPSPAIVIVSAIPVSPISPGYDFNAQVRLVHSFSPSSGRLQLNDGTIWLVDPLQAKGWKYGDQLTIESKQSGRYEITGPATILVAHTPVATPVIVSSSHSSIGGPIVFTPASPASIPSSAPVGSPYGSSSTGSYSTLPLRR